MSSITGPYAFMPIAHVSMYASKLPAATLFSGNVLFATVYGAGPQASHVISGSEPVTPTELYASTTLIIRG